ncbi:ATP-dependent DNA helicase RecG [Kerstersia similis]|uniref:ATP-dependent DNA helicase RecG n=1 Tax=Kerstersia similis TaxID=206505 RepID=UPI0039EEA529
MQTEASSGKKGRQGARGGRPSAATVAGRLERLGLRRPEDFALHLPLRYEDETQVVSIAQARPGAVAQVSGTITRNEVLLRPRRQLSVTLTDDSGSMTLRWLNFYPNQRKQVEEGAEVRAIGEVRGNLFGKEIIHPRIVAAGRELPQTLTPVYPTTEGLSQLVLRKAIAEALPRAHLADILPASLRASLDLMDLHEAVMFLHAPTPGTPVQSLEFRTHPAWRRVMFDEMLAHQLSMAAARAARLSKRARPLALRREADSLTRRLLARLPFALTAAQQRVVAEISADLGRTHPMHRLLQGDVGSGKTVVAALAATQAIDAGAQVALMAPTELLAEQHFRKLVDWLEPLGVPVAWLSGSQKAKARREALQAIAAGQAPLVVGTQALVQDHVDFDCLGLVIVDEQHRFGVGQRLALSRKGEDDAAVEVPHLLNMSATPIPRTLAMTHFADLDVSVIDELPPGRTPVRTKLVEEGRREEVIALVAQAVREGRQAYWVCPLVEESEALALQTAVDTHAVLSAALPDLTLGLVHGRLSAAEKAVVMDGFRKGDIDLLVATTVIEVGVDVPNASLMVIEHAERFGLAQLHQLRGRVGRGAAQSVCVLLYQGPLSAHARDRLKAMYETNDGFEIARRDLEQRGPGEFLGTRQSGMAMLRYGDTEQFPELAEQARDAARLLLRDAPEVAHAHLDRWMSGREDFLRT